MERALAGIRDAAGLDRPARGGRAQPPLTATGAVLVAGPAGTGKSWLLARASDVLAATERHRIVQALTAAGTRHVPLGALAPLLPPGALPRNDLPTAGVLRAAADALGGGPSSRRRLVVVADNAQFLDEMSGALLYRLALEGRSLVLLAARSGQHFPASFVELHKQGRALRIDLRPVNRADADAFLESLLGGLVARSTTDRLWRATAGNQELLAELVAAGRDSGALSQAHGVWRWRGRWPLGARLAELVDERLGRPRGRALDLVEMVAHGDPVPLAFLRTAFTAAEVEAAEAAGVIHTGESPDGPLVTLVAPLLAAMVRAHCPALRAGNCRRQLGLLASAALKESGGRAPPHTVSLCQAGRVPVPSGTLVRAARHAFAAGDFRSATSFASDALAAGERLSVTAAVQAAAVLWRATLPGSTSPGSIPATTGTGEETAAGAVTDTGARTATGAATTPDTDTDTDTDTDITSAPWAAAREGSPPERERERGHPSPEVRDELAMGRAWAEFCRAGGAAEAVRQLRAVQGTTVDPARIRSAEAFMLACRGRSQDALRLVSSDLVPFGGDPEPSALALCVQGTVWARRGQFARALAALDRADVVASKPAHPSPLLRAALAHARCQACLLAGESQHAVSIADDAYRVAAAYDWPQAMLWACTDLARAARIQGWIGTARRSVHEGLRLLDEYPAAWPGAPALHREHAALAALAGDARLAAEALARIAGDDEGDGAGHGGGHVPSGSWAELVRAWTAHADGDLADAGRIALSVAAAAARHPELAGFEPLALHDAVRLGHPAPAARRLRELAGHSEHALAPLLCSHAEAATRADATTLERVAAEFAERTMHLQAAEAYAEAARVHQAKGHGVDTQRLRARAALFLERSGGAPAVTVLSRSGFPWLTPRELDIARLAADGLPSRAIASALSLSVRTVDNHLHHVYAKLGLSGRTELAAVFAPSGTEAAPPDLLADAGQNSAASSRKRRSISSPSRRNSR
ncbi:LuxR C-terminal-related transcriptional regulator [Streptomyces sp. NPDC059009]|uniref:LuxR C-terminal-related transcriptional regulator n=1 Tax=Streptomyces sp. NPDC059009 TaxID=3346694 RepID=UPI0036CBC873